MELQMWFASVCLCTENIIFMSVCVYIDTLYMCV